MKKAIKMFIGNHGAVKVAKHPKHRKSSLKKFSKLLRKVNKALKKIERITRKIKNITKSRRRKT